MSVVAISAARESRAAGRSRFDEVVALACEASIEINLPEIKYLQTSRSILPAGQKMYVSHLPKQSWAETIASSREIKATGFDPVPHVPVRLFADADEAERVIAGFASAGVAELLIISGDYARSAGPYTETLELLRTGLLAKYGIGRVSFAGHPEGHPRVSLDEIRRAEVAKTRWAEEAGLSASIVTQFFFESAPFVDWAQARRRDGVRARIIAGVAGPASIAKLARYAMRCGVGRSVRALAARPNFMTKLMDEHGPETLLAELADARLAHRTTFDGIHLFGFGGYLKTCEWLQRIATGDFKLDA